MLGSERSSRAGSRSSSRENSQASISVSADILSTSTSSNSTLAFSAPGAYSRGRERWRSSGAYNLPRKNSSAVDYSAAPFSHRPKVSPVVNQTPEWFVEEPAIVLDDANMIEYRVLIFLFFCHTTTNQFQAMAITGFFNSLFAGIFSLALNNSSPHKKTSFLRGSSRTFFHLFC